MTTPDSTRRTNSTADDATTSQASIPEDERRTEQGAAPLQNRAIPSVTGYPNDDPGRSSDRSEPAAAGELNDRTDSRQETDWTIEAARAELEGLAAECEVLDIATPSGNPDQIVLVFHSRGVGRVGGPEMAGISSQGASLTRLDHHEVALEKREATAFPILRFRSPTFHPVIGDDGRVDPAALGIDSAAARPPWDVLAERLWEVVRGAAIPPEAVEGISAELGSPPWSHQPLRKVSGGRLRNEIDYRRRTAPGLPSVQPAHDVTEPSNVEGIHSRVDRVSAERQTASLPDSTGIEIVRTTERLPRSRYDGRAGAIPQRELLPEHSAASDSGSAVSPENRSGSRPIHATPIQSPTTPRDMQRGAMDLPEEIVFLDASAGASSTPSDSRQTPDALPRSDSRHPSPPSPSRSANAELPPSQERGDEGIDFLT